MASRVRSPLPTAGFHDAGGSEVQELAFVLAAASPICARSNRPVSRSKMPQGMVYARLSADADQFLTLAKFRALRLLWARIEQACGLTPKPLFIAADTAWRMLTQRDAYVNMLRATMATFSAGLGGANAITVLPHTLALGLPDPFARRVARNTQLVLLEESNLAKVSDPAAGSGGIETLTRQLCEAAWSLFQEIEKAGGLFASLEQSLIQRKVAATRAAREANIAKRRDVLTGASEFPNLHEADVAVLDAKPIVLAPYGEAKIQIRSAAADAAGGAVRSAARQIGQHAQEHRRAAKDLPRQSRHGRRFHRARHLCQEFLRDRRHRGDRHRGLRRPGGARRRLQGIRRCAGVPVLVRQGLCRARDGRCRRPFKPPAPSISIWQAVPASRKPRCVAPVSAISSLPAATRWRCCGKPGGGWSEHDRRAKPF